jgi:S23 ribosomal protein.
MAGFRRFEDIKSWQKAREINREIYLATTNAEFSKDCDLRNQIRRASISIMANIAEGFGRRSDREFANFLNIAHASACEAQSTSLRSTGFKLHQQRDFL